jgi:hypothetical protein
MVLGRRQPSGLTGPRGKRVNPALVTRVEDPSLIAVGHGNRRDTLADGKQDADREQTAD